MGGSRTARRHQDQAYDQDYVIQSKQEKNQKPEAFRLGFFLLQTVRPEWFTYLQSVVIFCIF